MTPAPDPVSAHMAAGNMLSEVKYDDAPCRLPRPPRQRRPLRSHPIGDLGGRVAGHPLYRRHDRLAQRRDADPRQSDSRLRAYTGGADPRRRRRCARAKSASSAYCRCSTFTRCPSSCCSASAWERSYPSSALRSGGRAQGHRAEEDHRLHGRADDACRDAQPARIEKDGFLVAALCAFGRRALARRGPGAVEKLVGCQLARVGA